MKYLFTTCVVFVLAISIGHAFAAELNMQLILKCTELNNRMAGASDSGDFHVLEATAEERVKYCSNADNARDNSDAYAALADIRNFMGKSTSALEAGTKCVELDPTNPLCQVALSKAYYDVFQFEASRQRRDAAFRLFEADRLRLEQELISRAQTKAMEADVKLLLSRLYRNASSECWIRRLRLPND